MVAIISVLLGAIVGLSVSGVQAAPAVEKRLPGHFYPIIEPNANTVWTIGTTVTATWCVDSSLPCYLSQTILIPLAARNTSTLSQDNFDASWLDLYHSPMGSAWFVDNLATGFDLRPGAVSFTVPDVPAGDYFVMCMCSVHSIIITKINAQFS